MPFHQLKRREFITLLGSAAAAWPLAARAQQSAMPVIGFLSTGSANGETELKAAFVRGLGELGYAEGRNVAIAYRWAEGHYDRAPALATDLVRQSVAVIFAGGPASALAAKTATTTIPIVFANGADSVQLGLVASLNRPGGNITGVSFYINELGAKQLELLHKLAPKAKRIAALVNPTNPNSEAQSKDLQSAAGALGLKLYILKANTEGDIDQAFSTLVKQRADALLETADSFLGNRRHQIVALAARHSIPAMYPSRQMPIVGGLASYGTNVPDAFRQAGIYVGRVLKGEKPADLPVVQSSKFELVFNLATANALGLKIPEAFLLRADEVIE